MKEVRTQIFFLQKYSVKVWGQIGMERVSTALRSSHTELQEEKVGYGEKNFTGVPNMKALSWSFIAAIVKCQ